MELIRPFRGLRVAPRHAGKVSAPPYDVLDTEEARALAAGNPDSFLYVSKPEIDFPPGTDPHAPEVHRRGREHLDRLVGSGRLVRDEEPAFGVYRVVMGAHVQTGLVAAASMHAYLDGRIKLHEHTRADKVEDRARNADALDAHTGTLFLTYRADPTVDQAIAAIAARPPTIDVTAEDGVRHSLWTVFEPQAIEALAAGFNAMAGIYMADGHHRSAAAAMLHDWRSARITAGETVAAADWFLSVLFPDNQVQILPYNRAVTTLGEQTPAQFVEALGERFSVRRSEAAVEPERAGVFGVYVDGRWYRLEVDPESIPGDALGRLDINLLQRRCLQPVLGIADQRTDERVQFVGGIRGTDELERLVDGGAMKAAFSLYPTQLADVLAVADAGDIMPPKSTWFEPKLRDGLVVLPLS